MHYMTKKELEAYLEEAEAIHQRFNDLRDRMHANTTRGSEAINKVDKTFVRKVFRFPGDISPARLVNVARQLLGKPNARKGYKIDRKRS